MTDKYILHLAGSDKDINDNSLLRKYFESKSIEARTVPFFVIGGDCVITEKHAILGWAIPQVTGWAYRNYEKGIIAIKKGLERFELEPLLIDDIQNLDENMYHKRRLNGFFHLDMLTSFIENKDGGISAVVSQPPQTYKQKLQDSIKYAEYASELLDKNGYPVNRAPAILSDNSLWSPTNILIDEERRKIFLSDSFDEDINKTAEEIYKNNGYATIKISIDKTIQEAKAGVRCMSFLIKE